MDTEIKKEIEKLKYLLSLEKKEEESFFEKQFHNFSIAKIEKAVKDGICWYPLSFLNNKSNDKKNKIKVTFSLPQDMEEEHSFQPTSSVKIFQVNPETGSIINISKGIINLIYKDKVELFYSAPKPLPWMEKESGVGIFLTFSKYTYKIMEKVLTTISQTKNNRLAKLRDIMLGGETANFSKYFNPYSNKWLNSSQHAAVNLILSSRDVAVVHGPPGTGKTTTLVEAVIETLKSEPRVMVCAYNNIAVDIIAEKLMEQNISVVRIGNPAKVTDELLNITYESLYYEHPYYTDILSCKKIIKELQSEYDKIPASDYHKKIELLKTISTHKDIITELEWRIKSSIFGNNKVVAATMIGSSLRMLNDISFSTVFIDEAAQALEPACWVPITKANRVVFAGDHHQLPPTVKSYEAVKAGLLHTLFEKIIKKNPECCTMLTVQYRMHESIMNFSSQWFYKNCLVASPIVQNKTLLDNDIPIEWIDTSLCEFHEKRQVEGTSIFNIEEVDQIIEIVIAYIKKIGESRIIEEKISFGIISPYSAQVNLFKKKIKKNKFLKTFLSHKLISIKTIDGFQGQERDVIIISLVRSNYASKIGFLADYRRINVAITRAKKKLFLIGDSSTLCEDPFFEALFLYVQKNGIITELSIEDEDEDEDEYKWVFV